MTFGKSLQHHREAAGLSQTELARRSDTPIDSLRNWEQSKAMPRIDAVVRLARALDVALDELVADVSFAAPSADAAPPATGTSTGKAAGKPRKRSKGQAGATKKDRKPRGH